MGSNASCVQSTPCCSEAAAGTDGILKPAPVQGWSRDAKRTPENVMDVQGMAVVEEPDEDKDDVSDRPVVIEVAKSDAQPRKPQAVESASAFHVSIEKSSGQGLGLRIAAGLLHGIMPGVGLITEVFDDGAVELHNRTCPEQSAIHPGCIIYAVNGEYLDPFPRELLEKEQKLELSCVNWTRQITIAKGPSGLGLKFQKKWFVCLIAEVMEGGSVVEYNEDHPTTRIEKDDYILRVNGQEGAFEPLLHQLKSSAMIDMTVLRIRDKSLVPVAAAEA